MLDIFTKRTPLYSPLSAPPRQQNSMPQVRLLMKLAFMATLTHTAKYANPASNSARVFGSIVSADDSDYNGVGSVETPKIFVVQYDLFV